MVTGFCFMNNYWIFKKIYWHIHFFWNDHIQGEFKFKWLFLIYDEIEDVFHCSKVETSIKVLGVVW